MFGLAVLMNLEGKGEGIGGTFTGCCLGAFLE